VGLYVDAGRLIAAVNTSGVGLNVVAGDQYVAIVMPSRVYRAELFDNLAQLVKRETAEQMFALVEDIEAYPQFLPWCVEAEVRRSRH
jgi:DNA-binding cell septation regulator SpoVG